MVAAPSLRRAFSLVELLVVIGIIGVLVALLLPAVQAAREAARRTACRANLRQVGLGLLSFHDVHRKFPTGGWGRAWIGVPERGTGVRQPGGWIFQILPMIEEQSLYELGRGASGAAQSEAYSQRLATPLALFNCASRRGSAPLPAGMTQPHQKSPRPTGQVAVVARGDYAINSGATHAFPLQGPLTEALGDDPGYWRTVTDNTLHTGISHLRRSASLPKVLDGMSHTLLAGEKFLAPLHYESSAAAGDNDTLYSGYDYDHHRFVANGLDPPTIYSPQMDNDTLTASENYFGSAHPAGLNMVLCDGSSPVISYDIQPELWRRLGHRADGELMAE